MIEKTQLDAQLSNAYNRIQLLLAENRLLVEELKKKINKYEIASEVLREYDLDDAFHLRANVWSKNTVAHVNSWLNNKKEQ